MNDATETKTIFKVPAHNISKLQAQFEDLNKKVARLHKRGYTTVEHVVINVDSTPVIDIIEDIVEGEKVTRERISFMVTLVSPKTPKVEGWEFVAALTHVEDVGTVLRVCPGAEVAEGELAKYRTASSDNCDHCNASRRRNDTFVIRNVAERGTLKQVGRQCLQAYTGLKNPEWLCAAAEMLFSAADILSASEDDGFGGEGGGRPWATVKTYMPFVCCSIREDGWLSRGQAYKEDRQGAATADLAFSKGLYATSSTKNPYKPTEKDYNLAAAIIEFCEEHFEGCDVAAISDYENSLRVAMASGIVHPKFSGIIASAAQFYNRDLERRARAESWSKMVANSDYQGKVGDRIVFENIKVVAAKTWESQFGTTYFYSFVTPEGHALVWKASSDMDLAIGQVISLKATVKAHQPYTVKANGATYKQTIINRGALVTRAKVVSVGTHEEFTNVEVKPASKPGEPFEFAQYERRTIVMNDYHFESTDGRKFVFTSKSKKKALTVGVEALVEYLPDTKLWAGANKGERPCGLVK